MLKNSFISYTGAELHSQIVNKAGYSHCDIIYNWSCSETSSRACLPLLAVLKPNFMSDIKLKALVGNGNGVELM